MGKSNRFRKSENVIEEDEEEREEREETIRGLREGDEDLYTHASDDEEFEQLDIEPDEDEEIVNEEPSYQSDAPLFQDFLQDDVVLTPSPKRNEESLENTQSQLWERFVESMPQGVDAPSILNSVREYLSASSDLESSIKRMSC